ncbi:cell surface protein, partial [Flavobacterium psychrophilum]|nr:cell surface protein [Flavobacterium psychrophilum]
NSVTSIGDYAFHSCPSLTTINCHITSPLVINANVFGNITQSNCALNVPTGTQAVYQAAAVWRNFSPISGSLLSNHSF